MIYVKIYLFSGDIDIFVVGDAAFDWFKCILQNLNPIVHLKLQLPTEDYEAFSVFNIWSGAQKTRIQVYKY